MAKSSLAHCTMAGLAGQVWLRRGGRAKAEQRLQGRATLAMVRLVLEVTGNAGKEHAQGSMDAWGLQSLHSSWM